MFIANKRFFNFLTYALYAFHHESPDPSKSNQQLTTNPSDSAVAHGENHASSDNGGNLRNGLAPQDCAASQLTTNKTLNVVERMLLR